MVAHVRQRGHENDVLAANWQASTLAAGVPRHTHELLGDSLTHLLTHSLTHSLTHLLTHSLTHLLTHSLIHIHSL